MVLNGHGLQRQGVSVESAGYVFYNRCNEAAALLNQAILTGVRFLQVECAGFIAEVSSRPFSETTGEVIIEGMKSGKSRRRRHEF